MRAGITRRTASVVVAALLAAAALQAVGPHEQSVALSTYTETTGGNANTWTNYTNAGGTQGPTIPAFTSVQITCALQGFRVANGNTWWYQIASPPWNNLYYVSADAFYNNGRTSGSLVGTPWVDPAVPTCASIAGGVPETTGGAANTWTNYTNAGGIQGPTIAAFTTVQIACAVTGFRVADGNTWWYRIASPPWNHAYYVSADAFYNNGRTSGSLAGTPFVDPAVALCGSGSGGSPGTGITQQQGSRGVNTFANYQNASGPGARVNPATYVQVSCKVYAPAIASVNPDGYWYRIASSPWNNQYYAPANTFMNGDPWGGPYTHNTDFAVPDCGDAPRPGSPTVSLARGPGAPAGFWYAVTLSGFGAGTVVSVSCRDSVDSRGFRTFTMTMNGSGSAFTQSQCYSGDGPNHWVVANGYSSNIVAWGSGGSAGTGRVYSPASGNQGSAPARSTNSTTCHTRYPVNCASGAFWHTFDDFKIPGRGVPLEYSHSYTSAAAGRSSRLGYGWTDSYNLALSTDSSGNVTVTEENGVTVTFTASSGGFVAPPFVQASLAANADGTYTFLRKRTQTRYVFSTFGVLLREEDSNGHATILDYDGTQLKKVTDPAGRSLTFTYAGNQVTSITDPAGNRQTFAYDAAGNLVTATDVEGGTWTFTYDPQHLLMTMTDPRGGTIANVYDSSARTVRQSDRLGRVTTWSYTGDNSSTSGGTTVMTKPNGNITTYSFTSLQLRSVTHGTGTPLEATTSYTYDPATLGIATATDPLGHMTRYTYDSAGNELSRTDPLGRTTTTTYSSLNKPLTITDPSGSKTTNTYDTRGNPLTTSKTVSETGETLTTTYSYGDTTHPGDVTSRTDPEGKTWTYGYNSRGDQNSTTDPLGNTETSTYDVLGRKLASVSARGNAPGATAATFTTRYTYNAFGDLRTTTDPLGRVTERAYNANRDLVSVTDPLGRTTITTYDAESQPTTETRRDGDTILSTSRMAYDANGNLIGRTDPNGHTTTYTYNALDRRTSSTDPLGRTTGYSYDRAGNQIAVADPSGRVTTNSYDSANQQTGTSYSGGTTAVVSYSYDANGRRTRMTDGSGTTTYTYDSIGRLIASTNGNGQTIGYAHDRNDHATRITYPNGKVVRRTFDHAGRMDSITDWRDRKTTFTFDPNGNVIEQVAGSNPKVTDTFTYDATDRMTRTTSAAGATTLQFLDYTRNPLGQVDSTSQPGKPTANYSYDQMNRLQQDGQGSYNYDTSGNITKLVSGNSYTYNPADELVRRGTGKKATTFSYSPLGERLAVDPPTGVTATYTYDQAGRLIGFTKGTASAFYGYDGDGLRTSKRVGSTTTQFAWDTTAENALLLTEGNTHYIYGPNDLPVQSIAKTGATTYFHHDQLGSTTLLTSAKGTKQTALTYSSYGAVRTGNAGKPLLHAGQYRDKESGLYYMRARYYDPGTGQFMTVDPRLDQTNSPYRYVEGDPINATDISGEFSWTSFVPGWNAVSSLFDSARTCAYHGYGSSRCSDALLRSTYEGILFGVGQYIGTFGRGPDFIGGVAIGVVGSPPQSATAPGQPRSPRC